MKWVNGTTLHYFFFNKPSDGENVRMSDGTTRFFPWATTVEETDIVRVAFKKWKDIGIGLEFKEVGTREEADIRIGFMRGDGAWSYIRPGHPELSKDGADDEFWLGPDRDGRAKSIRPFTRLATRSVFPTSIRTRSQGSSGMRKRSIKHWRSRRMNGIGPRHSIISFERSTRTKCRDRIGIRIRLCIIRLSQD